MDAGALLPSFRRRAECAHAVQGRVVDQLSLAPLRADVVLAVVDEDSAALPGRTTATAEGGHFTRILTPGLYYCMIVRAKGYVPSVAILHLEPGSARDASSTIEHDVLLAAAVQGDYSRSVPEPRSIVDTDRAAPVSLPLPGSSGRSATAASALSRMASHCAGFLSQIQTRRRETMT